MRSSTGLSKGHLLLNNQPFFGHCALILHLGYMFSHCSLLLRQGVVWQRLVSFTPGRCLATAR
jgi:hypothetical protein